MIYQSQVEMKEVEVLAYVSVIWRSLAEVRLRLVKVVAVKSLQQGKLLQILPIITLIDL